MLLGARDDGGECPVEPIEDQRSRLADLERERGVDDVGGGEAVVEPAALLAQPLGMQPLGHGVDEGRGVVVEGRLELGDPLRRGRCRVLEQCAGGVRRHDPELGPGRRRGELDLEPGPQLALVRPDPGHGRAGVAGDHCLQSRALPRRRRGARLPLRGIALGVEDPQRELGGVARVVDSDRGDRNARGHLRDRE